MQFLHKWFRPIGGGGLSPSPILERSIFVCSRTWLTFEVYQSYQAHDIIGNLRADLIFLSIAVAPIFYFRDPGELVNGIRRRGNFVLHSPLGDYRYLDLYIYCHRNKTNYLVLTRTLCMLKYN